MNYVKLTLAIAVGSFLGVMAVQVLTFMIYFLISLLLRL